MKVEIEDFQSLKKAEFTIEKFTSLIGRNNLGKSATARAVRSVVRNRGDFRRTNAKSNKVTLEFGNFRVTRIKGSSIDYEIDGKIQQSVGREVPQEIINAGLKPIVIGKDRVYAQFPNQFEKIFLLNQPNSVIAETISKIAKIDVVNNALRLVSRDRKRSESTLKIRREDLEKTKARLKSYEKVDDLNIKASEITLLKEEIEYLEALLQEIDDFIESLEAAKTFIKALSATETASIPDTGDLTSNFKILQAVQSFFSKFETTTNQVSNLSKVEKINIPVFPVDLLNSFSFVTSSIKSVTDLESQIKALEVVSSVEIPETSSIEQDSTVYNGLQIFEKEYENLQDSVSEIEQEIEQVTKELEKLKEEISSIKKDQVCPFKEVFGCKENW